MAFQIKIVPGNTSMPPTWLYGGVLEALVTT